MDAGLGSGVGYGCGGRGDREGQGCEEVGEEHGWMWVSLGFLGGFFWWSLGLEIGLRVVILDLCGTALGLLYPEWMEYCQSLLVIIQLRYYLPYSH